MTSPKKKTEPETQEKKRINPLEVLQIHGIIDGDETRGWVHTHGMQSHGLPELEIVGLPLFMVPPATSLLNEIADYMLNEDAEVLPGQRMQIGRVLVGFVAPLEPLKGGENHYEYPVLRVVDPDKVDVPRIDPSKVH